MTLPGFEDIEHLSARALIKVPTFLEHIKKHPVNDPVISGRIENGLGLTGPEVRAMIAACVNRGEPVASGPKGYWWAYSPEEVETTITHLLARITALQTRVRDYRRVQTKMQMKRQLTLSMFGDQA